MLRPLALTELHEEHISGVICFKEQQLLCKVEFQGDMEQHIRRKVFWKGLNMSGWGLACPHARREGSNIHAHALPGNNTRDLESVTAGAFSLLFDPGTFFLFTLGSPFLQLPPGCLPFSRLLSHSPFIILGLILLVLTGEFFSSLASLSPPRP